MILLAQEQPLNKHVYKFLYKDVCKSFLNVCCAPKHLLRLAITCESAAQNLSGHEWSIGAGFSCCPPHANRFQPCLRSLQDYDAMLCSNHRCFDGHVRHDAGICLLLPFPLLCFLLHSFLAAGKTIVLVWHRNGAGNSFCYHALCCAGAHTYTGDHGSG